MKEIKFRAWKINEKKYYYLIGFVEDMKSNTIRIWWDQNGTIINQSFSISEKCIIIEQYTGLKDKNGKKIYEGDILKNGNDIMVVGWNKKFASFCLNKKGWLHSHFGEAVDATQYEIIGNKYENP